MYSHFQNLFLIVYSHSNFTFCSLLSKNTDYRINFNYLIERTGFKINQG
jgi:hypothetical protein